MFEVSSRRACARRRSGTASATPKRVESRTRSPRSRRSRRGASIRAGFTLIETALTTIIVGVGVLAIVAAQSAFHQKNDWSSHASIAMHLGNEIREGAGRLRGRLGRGGSPIKLRTSNGTISVR